MRFFRNVHYVMTWLRVFFIYLSVRVRECAEVLLCVCVCAGCVCLRDWLGLTSVCVFCICMARLVLLGMFLGSVKSELIPNPNCFDKTYRHHFGASRFLHSLKQCLLFIQAWPHFTQKWYQQIWDKTLFHKMYNSLLFINDF